MSIEFLRVAVDAEQLVTCVYTIDKEEVCVQWIDRYPNKIGLDNFVLSDKTDAVTSKNSALAERVLSAISMGNSDENPDLDLYLFVRNHLGSLKCKGLLYPSFDFNEPLLKKISIEMLIDALTTIDRCERMESVRIEGVILDPNKRLDLADRLLKVYGHIQVVYHEKNGAFKLAATEPFFYLAPNGGQEEEFVTRSYESGGYFAEKFYIDCNLYDESEFQVWEVNEVFNFEDNQELARSLIEGTDCHYKGMNLDYWLPKVQFYIKGGNRPFTYVYVNS